MNTKKDFDQLIENFVTEERNTTFNPFLSTRIMAAIDKKRNEKLVVFSPLWRTALIALSLLIAVLTGVATGSLYQPEKVAADMVLMDDSSMENFSFYNEIGNE